MRKILKWIYLKIVKILIFFEKEEKDDYLEYLKKTTSKKWVKYNTGYLCEEKNFFIELDDIGNAKCTRDARTIPYQTCLGPFCKWFTVPKQNVHLYLKN